MLYNAGNSGGCVTPYFVVQPQGRVVTNGANITFTGLAIGSGPVSYQWQLNGANLPGATGTNLVLAGVSDDASGAYTLLAMDTTGTGASQPAKLVVATRAAIVAHPQSTTN